jgi:hypothetical protein
MNLVSTLQSEKKLVDVTGLEPVTPCLQRLVARKINNLQEVQRESTKCEKLRSANDFAERTSTLIDCHRVCWWAQNWAQSNSSLPYPTPPPVPAVSLDRARILNSGPSPLDLLQPCTNSPGPAAASHSPSPTGTPRLSPWGEVYPRVGPRCGIFGFREF